MKDQVRELFEKWVLSNGGNIDRTYGGEYKSVPTECAWSAWLASEMTRTDQAAAKICCGEYETCDRPCTPRGRYLADKDERIRTYKETDHKPKETPRIMTAETLEKYILHKMEEDLKEKGIPMVITPSNANVITTTCRNYIHNRQGIS